LAAEREALEEAGAIIKADPAPIAKILEIRSDDGIEQLSLLYTGVLISKNKGVNFTAAETSEGYKGAVWVSEAQALELFKNDRPKTYLGKFMHARDLKFLEYAIARSQR
jgi:8-oxo-dGTP pyrophosphatase MutT (NUDIX family)